jgi:hypothetical protein
VTQYRQGLDQQQGLAQQQTAPLQQQNRMAQYRFQEQYSERQRQQRIGLQNGRDHDYNDDPYFYTAPSYRSNRGGNYYQTNHNTAQICSAGRITKRTQQVACFQTDDMRVNAEKRV